MTLRNSIYLTTIMALMIITAAGCSRDTEGLALAKASNNPIVFDDDFSDWLDFQAFEYSDTYALDIDTDVSYRGTASLIVEVPGPGGFAGGAFVTYAARDLTEFNALTFWAKASRRDTMDVVGLGNNNSGESKYEASWSTLPLDTEWKKYVIPIPDPSKLNVEQGLFFFADAVSDGRTAFDFWFDDIIFESIGTISNPRPSMTSETLEPFVGATVKVNGTQTIFKVGATDQKIEHLPGYFNFFSSDHEVAAIIDGEIKVVGIGTAIITAKLDSLDVDGEVMLVTTGAPMSAAPTPAEPAGEVISLFSDAPGYVNATVDTWAAPWSGASQEVTDFMVAGNVTKVYTNLTYAGIEFASETIDASDMTYFHMDVWVPSGTYFQVKLVDFGADGVYGGAPDSEHELRFNATSTPPLVTGEWVSLDMSLDDDFTRLITRAHVAQLVISGNTETVFLDNIYFHK